ncbi:N-acetylglucosamine-6-phosphate deacetylase [Alkalinema pantanalense CENA528]|uniref:N-acetylglucosamine-6-phosphate deacetylase n=1 Tax=Alkalinema pantanalense TaxID=1620705 RepID=UPI003D6F7700
MSSPVQADRTNVHQSLWNARIPGLQGCQSIGLHNGEIVSITPQQDQVPLEGEDCINVAGDWISLGGVDLQINGALGLAFPDLTLGHIEVLEKVGQFLWHQGVDAYCPTIVTTSIYKIHQSLAAIDAWMTRPHRSPYQAQIIGVHLEGPFLNPAKRGAHPAEFILPLTVDNVKLVLDDYAHVVKIMTLAPEMDDSHDAIDYLRSLNITVSLGHSQATATQAQAAFDHGATMVTHAFNAMPSLHHREPGLLGAAIVDDRVQCGFIADGQHVVPLMLDLLIRASSGDGLQPSEGHQGLFLVSDALSPLGLPDGLYPWDSRQIEVTAGTARLPDGTLSGTTLPLLEGACNLVKWGICPPETAIALATIAPRQAIGLSTDYIGQSQDNLLRWHQNDQGLLQWQRLTEL